MKKYLVIAVLIFSTVAFTTRFHRYEKADVDSAIKKSLPLLESSSHAFLKNVADMINCHSCHNQGLGLVTFAMAKERGFAVNDSILLEAIDSTCTQWKTPDKVQALMENDDPTAVLITGDYDLWGLKENNISSTKLLDLISVNIMRKQRADGSWFSIGQRPPLEYYSFSVTALAVKNMQAYMPAVLKEEVKMRINKAESWMMRTTPVANEEKVFQLLGLSWCDSDKDFIHKKARQLIAAQHSDGGWSQLDSLPSDSYATGQALYALYKTGNLQLTDIAFEKGINFLLHTQKADGSWHVKSRSIPFVPYVNSGFPHKGDQFISAAGSNWATMALLLTVDKK